MTYTVTLQPSASNPPFTWTGEACSDSHAVWLAQRAAANHNLTGGPEFLPVDHSPLFANPQSN